ncbi:hypothetical protein REPUB_Repub06bG0125400 [Reevesia pubescens]
MELGIRWRVRNGENIRLWHDKWLPRDGHFTIRSPLTTLNLDSYVRDLIDEQRLSWNEDLVYSIFSKEEADLICSIPLSTTGSGDTLVWHYDKKGRYNVKSGYRLLSSLNQDGVEEVQNQPVIDEHIFWESLWKTEVPHKVKVFAWKLAHGALPTMVNLFKRNIQVDQACFRCSLTAETTLHVVLECKHAENVWQQTSLTWPQHTRSFASVRNWMEHVLLHSDSGKRQLFLATAWAIWNGRNGELHGE